MWQTLLSWFNGLYQPSLFCCILLKQEELNSAKCDHMRQFWLMRHKWKFASKFLRKFFVFLIKETDVVPIAFPSCCFECNILPALNIDKIAWGSAAILGPWGGKHEGKAKRILESLAPNHWDAEMTPKATISIMVCFVLLKLFCIRWCPDPLKILLAGQNGSSRAS